jgi:starch synthase (maltosyl-transferring)
MHNLAMIGFHQSYTYFTWRNSAAELTEYLRELSGPAAAYMRPNFFVNTPDILSEYLQHGGPAAFRVRAVLAATLAPTWGVYSGYELCENVSLVPGSEEYLNSEKYQYRPRDWAHADSIPPPQADISPLITSLNMVRKAHPALHWLRNLRFHHSDQPEILCYSKSVGPQGREGERDTVLVVVNIDPHQPREATVWLDVAALGISPGEEFVVTDELSGDSYRWSQANYVRLDPAAAPAHIFTVKASQPVSLTGSGWSPPGGG